MSARAIRLGARLGWCAVPFLLATALFAPSTIGGKVLSASDIPLTAAPYPQPGPAAANPLQYDAGYVFEPDALQARTALRSFTLPTWTPLQSAGTPLLAQEQTAPLYPLTWLTAILPFYRSLAWIAVLKVGLAALGAMLLGRALGFGRWPALLAGISFAFGSYFVDWLGHPHDNDYLLLPWLILAVESIGRRARARDAAWLSALVGLALLGGQPEGAAVVLLAAGLWALFRLACDRPPRRALLIRLGLLLAGALVGVAIGAVMLLPTRELVSQNPGYSRSVPGLPPSSAISLLFPNWWGIPTGGTQTAGPLNFAERTAYVGVIPLLLAIAGLWTRRVRREQLFFAVLAIVCVAVSIRPTGVADVLNKLPVLGSIDLTRVLILASFSVAMLAGYGLQRWLAAPAGERRSMLVVVVLAGIAPPVLVLVFRNGWLSGTGPALHHLVDRDLRLTGDQLALSSVLRALVLAVVTGAALALGRRVDRRLLAAGLVAVTLVDLFALGSGYNPSIALRDADPPTPAAVTAMRRLTAGGGRVTGIGVMQPNTASRWGLADARGHEDPSVARISTLFSALGGVLQGSALGFSATDRRTPRLLDLFGVRAVLLAPSRVSGDRFATAPVLDGDPVAYTGRDGVVVRNPGALPTAFVAYRWRPERTPLAALFTMAAGPATEDRDDPVIETAAGPVAGAPVAATPARIVRRTDTSTTVRVRARRAGRLVLLDTFYPGWHATVNGHAAPIAAADYGFRSVAVPRGADSVIFSFRPSSVRTGEILSLVGIALFLLGAVLGGRALSEVPGSLGPRVGL